MGDPRLPGEWTSEGELACPSTAGAVRPRRLLTDEEYAQRLDDVRARRRDLERVDVLAGKVDARKRRFRTGVNTTPRRGARRSSSTRPTAAFRRDVPERTLARTAAVRSLQVGEPCDTYEDYSLGVRCIAHGGGLPDAIFPRSTTRTCASFKAELRRDQLRADSRTRVIPIADERPLCAVDPYLYGGARVPWEGRRSSSKPQSEGDDARLDAVAETRRAFHAHGRELDDYQATSVDPATWTAPWTVRSTSERDRTTPASTSSVSRGELRITAHARGIAPARLRAPEVADPSRHSNRQQTQQVLGVLPDICARSPDRRPRNAEKA